MPSHVVGIISSAITTIDRFFWENYPWRDDEWEWAEAYNTAYCALDKNLTKDRIMHKRLLKTAKHIVIGQQWHIDPLEKEQKKKVV